MRKTISNNDPILLLLREASRKRVCPGAVVCASRKGVVRYDHAVGFASLYPIPMPLVAQALFDVASLTKAVATTTAVMLLVDAGVVDLDQPIARVFPKFKQTGKGSIKVRHLLNHCSGLPAHVEFFKELEALRRAGEGPAPGPEALDWVVDRIAHIEAQPPETQSIYSDLGFILLGRMVELVTQQDLDRFCREQIFLPLGMEDTFFLPLTDEALRKGRLKGRQVVATEQCPWRGRLLRGEVHDDNCYAMGGVAGHAGLFSTANDLHRFALSMLRCSRGESSFLPAAVIKAFWRKPNLVPGSTWTLGWDTPSPEGSQAGSLFSRNSVGHLGFTGCSMWIDRDDDQIAVLLTNRVHPSRENPGITQLRPIVHNVLHSLLVQATTLQPPQHGGEPIPMPEPMDEATRNKRPVLHPPPTRAPLSFTTEAAANEQLATDSSEENPVPDLQEIPDFDAEDLPTTESRDQSDEK